MSDKLNMDTERETVARAICTACGEVPDHIGDAQGNAFRWQDYLEIADAAIAAMDAAPVSSPIVEDSADINLPEMESLADIAYAQSTPDDWDSDYRAMWQKLQVAERNKMQWRAYALQVSDAVSSYAARIRQLERELLKLKQTNT